MIDDNRIGSRNVGGIDPEEGEGWDHNNTDNDNANHHKNKNKARIHLTMLTMMIIILNCQRDKSKKNKGLEGLGGWGGLEGVGRGPWQRRRDAPAVAPWAAEDFAEREESQRASRSVLLSTTGHGTALSTNSRIAAAFKDNTMEAWMNKDRCLEGEGWQRTG